jgi:hypothetical protein
MSYDNPCDYSHLHPLLRAEMEARDEELRRNVEKWNSESKKENLNLLKGYVARDENGKLHFFYREPYRGRNSWERYTCCLWDYVIELPETMFPELKWEDKPIKTKLSVTKQ